MVIYGKTLFDLFTKVVDTCFYICLAALFCAFCIAIGYTLCKFIICFYY